jgi:hypothetical protein
VAHRNTDNRDHRRLKGATAGVWDGGVRHSAIDQCRFTAQIAIAGGVAATQRGRGRCVPRVVPLQASHDQRQDQQREVHSSHGTNSASTQEKESAVEELTRRLHGVVDARPFALSSDRP